MSLQIDRCERPPIAAAGSPMPTDHDPAALASEEASPGLAATEAIEVQLEGRKHSLGYEPGDTVLETLRRAGLRAPFSCQRGNCGTCLAFVVEGEVAMRDNNVLDPQEVAEGWVLTCQGVPASRRVVIDYDR